MPHRGIEEHLCPIKFVRGQKCGTYKVNPIQRYLDGKLLFRSRGKVLLPSCQTFCINERVFSGSNSQWFISVLSFDCKARRCWATRRNRYLSGFITCRVAWWQSIGLRVVVKDLNFFINWCTVLIIFFQEPGEPQLDQQVVSQGLLLLPSLQQKRVLLLLLSRFKIFSNWLRPFSRRH